VLSDEWLDTNGRIIAPILGATVALIIAFVAYPWQKRKDRQLEIGREARKCAQDFQERLEYVYAQIAVYGSVPLEDQRSLNASVAKLVFYFDDDDLEIAHSFLEKEIAHAKSIVGQHNTTLGTIISDENEELGKFVKMVRDRYHVR